MKRTLITLPLQLRAEEDGDGRTLEGRLVPYGETVEVEGERESFAPGVFRDAAPEGVVLLWQHDTANPIGRATALRDEADGFHGTFRLGDTPLARDAYALARDGIVGGLSVGFLPEQSRRTRGGVREHTRGTLLETSLVTFPAYAGAGVTATRGMEETMEETETVETVEVEETVEVVVDLSPIEQRLDAHAEELREVRNQLGNITTTEAGKPKLPMTLSAAYATLLQMVARQPMENRALADVIGTAPGNASGLIRDAFISELLGVLDVQRPLFSAAGTVQFPSAGYGIAFPQITQHTLVGKRGAEKTEIPSRELIVGGVTFPMEWFAGGVDVALELIAQSDPSVVEVVVGDLLDQYAMAVEIEFGIDAVAAATAQGAVLPITDWEAFSAAMIATSGAIREATGRPGDLLALTDASWSALVGLLNPSQPSISFGSGPDFTAESVAVGGITAFHAPYITVDLQFNSKALRKSERPPETVTATNVALMGRDIGVLGATVALPLYPAGIIKYAAAA
jgi:HK97 family phage prohead protease